jgi:biopolymer transport protein ExbB
MKGWLKWAALGAVLLPALAMAAWWNNDWKYRKEISFDMSPTGADIAGSVQDVPVLVRLSLANFSYFNDTKPDGSDFRLLAGDDKTPLKFHFEKYDPQDQMALLWVRVPQITGGSKTDKIYAYYGDADAPSAADIPGTYDAGTALVLSFNESSGLPQDSTAYKNNPTASTAIFTPAALIGGGVKFAGKESISIPASPSLRLIPNQGITASAWLRIEAPQSATVLALADQGKSLELAVEGGKLLARANLGGATATVTQPDNLVLSQWHHVALTAGSDKLTLYVDGVAAGSSPLQLQELGGAFTVGALNGARFLTGDIDEVQVSKTVRSADWLKASARGQGMDATLVVYGADGQKEGGSSQNYFVTIAKNLTIDGWVVIGICAAMLVIAIIIMILKAIFLSRVEGANARFLEDFQRMSGDARPLDAESKTAGADAGNAPATTSPMSDPRRYGVSTLYQIYLRGVSELNKRVAGKSPGAQRAKNLNSQSINAIRAAMDATTTRLQQRLSSQMVLLTIAISGGPFLGLLGTVIGVMITFAAIALSGDVNINAIAPGTAAALAATVAGLAVAIPALFGYNWLNTRIKSISADNRVFVDEFVTRLAEQFS